MTLYCCLILGYRVLYLYTCVSSIVASTNGWHNELALCKDSSMMTSSVIMYIKCYSIRRAEFSQDYRSYQQLMLLLGKERRFFKQEYVVECIHSRQIKKNEITTRFLARLDKLTVTVTISELYCGSHFPSFE